MAVQYFTYSVVTKQQPGNLDLYYAFVHPAGIAKLDQSEPHSGQYCLGAVGLAQFIQYALRMAPDGFLTYTQLARNLPVRVGRRHPLQDFELTNSQSNRGRHGGTTLHSAQYLLQDLRMKVGLSVHNRVNGTYELGGFNFLQNIAFDTRSD